MAETMAFKQESPMGVIDIRASRRALIGGSLGNLLEWYEFAIYAYMVPIVAPLFFHNSDPAANLLATFSIFALGFFLRPVGALIFGRLTDRVGRRPILILIISLMTVATTCIGLLPTYSQIGIWAPILLTVLRIAQGLSSGGEMGGAVSLMVESAPEGKRGLYGSWSFLGTTLGYVFGGGVATLLATLFSDQMLHAWGWRVGFLLAAPLGLVILYLRLNIDETPNFKKVSMTSEMSNTDHGIAPSVVPNRPLMHLLVTLGIVVVWNATGNTFMVGMPSFLSHIYGMSFRSSYFLALVTGLIGALTMPFFGALSDRVGRRPVLLVGTAGVFFLSYPLYAMLGAGFGLSLLSLAIAGVLIGILGGPMPALLSERFRTRNRATGVSVIYAVSVAVFGGTAPFIITFLARVTGDPLAAAYYTIGCAAISLVALVFVKGKPHLDVLAN